MATQKVNKYVSLLAVPIQHAHLIQFFVRPPKGIRN